MTEKGPICKLFDETSQVRATTQQPPRVPFPEGGIFHPKGFHEAYNNITLGQHSNLTADNMAEFQCQGIYVDDDNNPTHENVTDPGVISPGAEEVWNLYRFICPRRATTFPNCFASFNNYSKEEATKMSHLDIFLVFFPVTYINYFVVPQMNKVLDPATDLREFVWWIGYWFYMT